MADNTKKGITLADRDKKVLYIFAAICVLAAAYFFGFAKFNEQRQDVIAENEQLEQEVQKLRGMVAKRAQVEADTKDKNDATEVVMEKYPSELRIQNVISQFDHMERRVQGLDIDSETFSMNNVFFINGASLETSADAATTTDENGETQEIANVGSFAGYRSDTTIVFNANYAQLKRVLDWIGANPDRMNVSSVSVSNDMESKDAPLACSLVVSMYSVAREGAEFEEPIVNGIRSGKANIFVKE